MRTAHLSPVLLALAGLAACAQSAEPGMSSAEASGRQCFRPESVSGFNAEGRDTVYFTVGASQIYRAEIIGVCPDIDWSQRIAIRTTGAGSWVCHGLDAELLVPGPTGLQRCPVTDVRRLTDAEVQAHRARRR